MMEQYNLTNNEPYTLRKGESWELWRIRPVVGGPWLGCELGDQEFSRRTRPRFPPRTAGRYLPGSRRAIRVYDSVDVRFLLEDFFAKLALCYGPGTNKA